MYKPSDLIPFLASLGIVPKKGLSQNFLIDGNILRKMVSLADVKPGDVVIEIGPGPGALTQALLGTGARVIAIEKDPVLAQALSRLNPADNRLKVFCEDILSFSFEQLTPYIEGRPLAKVVANLPYHLTTPILAHLVERRDLFSSLTLMVQEEVARRFTGQPKTKDYSGFTIFLEYYTHPTYGFGVSRHCFYPQPEVDSAVVHLQLHPPPPSVDAEFFFRLTRTAFEHRRKMLRASLKDFASPKIIMKALEECGLSPLARPEELSLENFLNLYKNLINTIPASRGWYKCSGSP